jgi:hypothetical protein
LAVLGDVTSSVTVPSGSVVAPARMDFSRLMSVGSVVPFTPAMPELFAMVSTLRVMNAPCGPYVKSPRGPTHE